MKVFSAKIYFQAIRYRASGCGALGYCKFSKVFSAKIYFQAIRYHTSGRDALGYRKFSKVFSAKIYFQAIRYRASGCGALGYCKFSKVFSAKIYFQAIRYHISGRDAIALSQQVQNMYGMFIKYVTSRLGCLRLPVAANSSLNSKGIYTVFDHTPLPRIGDLPNGLHTDLKFQNQAIQCCFVRATWATGTCVDFVLFTFR